MAVSAAFLTTARSVIADSAEYAAFQTAYAAYASASRSQRAAEWNDCFSNAQVGLSPAYRLEKAIRDAVFGADGVSALSPLDLEAAVRQLSGEYLPRPKRPASASEEAAQLQELMIQDAVS
jgi:hypothetical protein